MNRKQRPLIRFVIPMAQMFLICFVAKWQIKHKYILFQSALTVGIKPQIEKKYSDISAVFVDVTQCDQVIQHKKHLKKLS